MDKLTSYQIRGYIGKAVHVKMDRRLGYSHGHNTEKIIYPVNYGFIPNTISGDGEELDAYILGIDIPIEEFIGKCIAIIHRLNDDDDKLIVVPDELNFTDDEIISLTHFQERFFISEIWR
ncbi:MAG: inorganic diphosphatase [Bacteriovorax sp.]|jgi:inorganic pyrophosphatase